ncbi:MAG: Ig-like domain-containing protein [Bacilli bacterium]|nr:Ig-like domain-containing protein [Bacilli bacterium]
MNRNKTTGMLVGTGLLLLTIVASTLAFKNNITTRTQASDYSLTLNNSNGISGNNVSINQNVTTDSGNYQVAFAYDKCSALNNGHATILSGGTIKNADHILSIHAITANFSTSGVLKFRTSYDGSSWGTYTSLTSGVPYAFSSNPYYVELATDGAHAVNLNTFRFDYTCEVNPSASGLPSEENGFTATDTKKDDYTIADVFDEDNELEVRALNTNGEDTLLNKSQYTYSVKNSNGVAINTAQAFASEGTYYLTVNYKSYPAVQIELTVSSIHVIDISLNTDLIRLRVGETAQLTASVNPVNATNQSINWSSSNTSVLTVSATGLVTAKAVGQATVTASSVDGNKTATCDFYVKAQASNSTATIIPNYTGSAGYSTSYSNSAFTTNGISLIDGQFSSVYGMSTTSYLLYANGGQAYMIMYFDRPYIIRGISVNAKYYGSATTLSYITDDDSTGASVSVSSSSNTNYSLGSLSSNTSASNGIAFIASNSTSGTGVYINQISLTLYDAEARFPTQIALQDTDCSLGYTKQLTPTFYPADTDMTGVTWTSSNTNIATVTANGLVYGNAVGTATITASIVNEYGRTISGSCEVNVHTVSATGVAIYAASTELAIGQTTQLHQVLTPSDTTNKNVTWSSSNNNVATVDSEGVVTAISAGTATITVRTVDGGFTNTVLITVLNQQLDAYTILLYLCGADLESENGQATTDIAEILSVSCPSNVNFVIQTGGAAAWKNYNISATNIGRYHVNNKSLVQDASLDQASMGDYETFRDFLEWGMVTYPAQKYGVIMWNHGGAMQGVCYDENFNDDSLYNSEVYWGVNDARILAGVSEKLEFIAYDVCLMAVQDVAEFNSHNFNYMIASQESESGTGYDYDGWLPTLYNNPANVNTVTLLTKIADTFMAEQGTRNNQTQAVYDLSKMSAYLTAFESLASKLTTVITSSSVWTRFKNVCNSAQRYGAQTYQGTTYYLFDVFDVSTFITKMQSNTTFKNQCSSQLTTLKTALTNLVVYEKHGSQTSGGGLCFFCPISGYAAHVEYDEYETNFTTWRLLCEKYGSWYD